MKQFYLKQLFVALFALCCMVANAQTTATVDGITYEFITEAKHATVIERESGSYRGNIVIPETVEYNGAVYSVTAIGNKAFYDCDGLTSITIPNSVTTIGWAAFAGCSGLTNITIPNSVTTIGYEAFYGCTGLTSITIPNSVTTIREYAFSHCTGLTSITIGNSVTTIGYEAFYGCTGLTSIVVESGNTKFDSRDGCNAIIETATNTLVAGCKNTIIPGSVTTIEFQAFYGCTGLTSITIPNSVTTIGYEAFRDCSNLTSITIPNSVTKIGYGAFRSCSGLTSIVVESGNTKYDSREGCNAIIETATNTLIAGCKNTVIPGSVTTIGGEAFYGCNSLTSITIPGSVTTIGESAFCYCSRLTSVTIPNSVTTIGRHAFSETGWWNNQPDGLIYKDGWLLSPKVYKSSGYIVIADGTKGIANGAFEYCDGLTSIKIPSSVTTIGEYAFYDCTGLTSITIPNSVTTIGDHAFYYCTGLTSVTIGEGVTTIGEWAFYGCTGLTSVTIGNSVTTIGESAFSHCTGLTSITIPNSVTTIGGWAFSGCSNITEIYCLATSVPSTYSNAFLNSHIETATLYVPEESIDSYKNTAPWSSFGTIKAIANGEELTYEFNATEKTATVVASKGDQYTGNIVIPETVEYNGAVYSVTAIGNKAFYYCYGLTSVTIPNSVTTIEDQAFRYCSSLTSITIPNSVTTIGNYAFSHCSVLTSIVVESGNTKYDSREGCNAIIETATNTLVAGCKNTVIPESVTAIGYYAFYGCTGLTSFTIPNSVTTIGESVFYGSGWWNNQPYGLIYKDGWLLDYKGNEPSGDIVIADGTKGIAGYAFYSCDGLTSITIPNSVTTIGLGAFSRCTGLTSVTMPNSVTTIGKSAFYGCTGLTSITIPNSVTTIGESAFSSCSGLTSISIPNSVTTIGYMAFWICTGLESIYLMGDIPPTVGGWNFTTTQYENVVLYVPEGTLATYQAADVWKEFKNIREFDTTGIEDVYDNNDTHRSNLYYDLQGRIVEQPTRGIYIHNGKKVFIK